MRQGISHAIYSLWYSWALAVGLIIFVNLVALIVNKQWVPVVTLCSAMILYTTIRLGGEAQRLVCHRLTYTCLLVLFWSGILMIAINLLASKSLVGTSFSVVPYNPDIPYINILILAPTAAILSGLNLMSGIDSRFCRNCQIIYGTMAERGFLGRMYKQESDYQMGMFFTLSTLVSIAEWVYYIFFYINVDLNSPDRFFFIWAPTLLYVCTLAFLGVRYLSLWVYYIRNVEGSPASMGNSTTVRYIIICDDALFLKINDTLSGLLTPGDEKIDTPTKLTVPYKDQLSDHEAELYFKGTSAITPDKMRYLYKTSCPHSGSNIFHFACLVNYPEEMVGARCKGEWVPLGMLHRYIFEGRVSAYMCAEIDRIYKVTMAWKSYDSKGYRLYDIKNYKPTFRLRDFRNWDVDYNDYNWLFVSMDNEDKPFFRIRKLWRRIINGVTEL